jgi:hypothetical protein
VKTQKRETVREAIRDLREHAYLLRRGNDEAKRMARHAQQDVGRVMNDVALLEEKFDKLLFAYQNPKLPLESTRGGSIP